MEMEIEKLLKCDCSKSESDIMLTLSSKLSLKEAKLVNMYKNWKRLD